ncbi:putative benzaldehyde dehydrogenase oxidoreductase protein [Rhodococcus aetherivorans]|uniref:Benzaldehyde dehydrogenase oxidoreductase protein n=1 Tax=Rhodococcus aetherivorans TaxID=191292 RepID=A0ABQ0YR00_9NOCA|nr:benzaldehyde dehydrogenase [Rhodococcus aetherivorans]ETT26550.1 Benzaldehyde dehydrogenase (NAD(+)) [Rhodococcus rhodochrous ATCC 21198]MDV6292442.1 benzaldehyde dehydrogenase [Rhodococcus aetherivorans]NGP26066.1 benzaldehyde dehydrogenase [Rhodococcus aetherivorans]GES38993.1 putative benzaldehyde dehydrogenase oxidoreductase protein [Rhodococcus aetherivorans]
MALLDESIWQGKIFAGDWIPGGAGEIKVVEPATGATLGSVGLADEGDLERAVDRAVAAQRDWAARPHTERAAVLRRAGDLWQRHADEIERWIMRESGSLRPKAQLETHVAAQECFEGAALPSHALGEILPSEAPRLSMSKRVPVGVVGVIAPFNFPLILAIRSVAPALALGNAVILKPDPRTAVCGGVALARIFEQAGLPAGVLSVLPAGADVGAALVDDPRVSVISFTGSTPAGRAVGAAASRNLKKVHLELGGNSAIVVLDDADLAATVAAGAAGSFLHQGQVCMTTGRHIVHESVYDEYVAQLAAKAEALPVGDPATEQVALGPIIDHGQLEKIHALVTASVDAGARLVAGGTYEGLFYRPTVLADVPAGAPAYAREVFGPVAPVVKFSTLDEAVALATDTEYGLSLGIFTRDVGKGLALAERIPTGIAHINDQTVGDEANIPFGGLGASGNGARFGGAANSIEAFTESRWITVSRDVPVYPF